jgi:hypothetical protein
VQYRALLISCEQVGFYRSIIVLLRKVSFFVLKNRVRQNALNLSGQLRLTVKTLRLVGAQRQYPDEPIQRII